MTGRPTHWQTLALAASLLMNLAVMAGFLLQRSHAESRLAEPITQTLQLDPNQRSALLAMQAMLRQQAVQARRRGAEHSRAMADVLRLERPDRKWIETMLAAANQERLAIQITAIESIIGFRAGLGEAQRRRFDASLDQPGFLRALAGGAGNPTQSCPGSAPER